MTTKIIVLSMIVILSLTTYESHALSCAPIELGQAFEDSDYVFHGKVTEKNYLSWDQQMPVVTFGVIESFKGNAVDQISVTVYEQWSFDFEVGLEYVVFVNRNELSLEISPCTPFFQAFPSSIEIVRLASIPGNDMGHQTSNRFYESLSDQEKIQFEENNNFLKEKRIERENSVLLQRNVITAVLISLIVIVGFTAFLLLRKRK